MPGSTPAAREISACSAPGLESCRLATGTPSVRRSVVAVRTQLRMRSRIDVQLK